MILPVKTGTGGYNIYLERGALKKAGEYLNLSRRALIVTDSGVPQEYAETVAAQCKEPNIVTLPERQISNGLAESVKMSLTSDKELFELFEKGNIKENIDTIIEKSLKIKRAVVEQDEKEEDLRKILNFGHTLAHAIESENEMQNLYHGECVALGMIPMCSDEVKNRLIPVLERLNLPTSTAVTADTIIKMSGDKITVILVNTVGTYEMKEMPFDVFAQKIRGSLG